MEEDSMINMPDLVFDEKIGNKRVRDSEEEIHKGRLEKRPSGVSGGRDQIRDGGGDGDGGIIDTFISNVFQKNRNGTESEVKTGDEDRREYLGVDGGGRHGGDGDGDGGGIISGFFSNIFHPNPNGSTASKSDHILINEVADEKTGGGINGGEPEDLNAEKLALEKKDKTLDLPASKGHTSKLKPDDYSERVFFLNNN